MCINSLICRNLGKKRELIPQFFANYMKNCEKIHHFSKMTDILTFFSCNFKEKYLNLQNNKQKNKKIITLKKYQHMNDADGQKT